MSDKAVERETTKLFVGNVPFKCTLDEFREVFQDLDGFKNAELIQRGKSNLTRGFGVVEFNSADYLDDHCDREYELKGRTLRVTRYQPQEKEQRSYKIFLRGVAGLTEQDLENAFGLDASVLTLVSRETLLTPLAPEGALTDGYQTSAGSINPQMPHDHGSMHSDPMVPNAMELSTAVSSGGWWRFSAAISSM